MPTYADLEIGLHRRDADHYSVELRFSHPESDADVRLIRQGPTLAQFDLDHLRLLALDTEAYGQFLGQSLLADPAVGTAFAQARSTAQTLDLPLRLRLFVGPSAPELHSLRWETLRDPEDGSLLLTGENILFSRYLSSSDWRAARIRPRTELRALVVIANPAGLSDYQPEGRPLASLDVNGELERARSNLGTIPITALASGGEATLSNITHHLRDGFDVLYLVCHGALLEGQSHLWLENESGDVEVVPGNELVTRLSELRQQPRMVVLASCQSSGKGDDTHSNDEGALAAIGPRLAEAGVPAVIAMQGNITLRTLEGFMPDFFQELQRDGQIDRALALARGAVRERPDWWVPVLFMRLKSGRLWYAPGFADERHAFEKWPALLRNIRSGRCTPILGPGLTESLLGSRREIARRWAETYHYPMAVHHEEDLPQVAQYLAINLDEMFPRDELGEYLRRQILERYGDSLPDDLEGATLGELISAVGAQRRAADPAEAHRVLAQFPLPIYITADPSNLLAEALSEADRDPQVELCRWNPDIEFLPSIYDDEPAYRPTAERPLVYHLFGHLREPDSIVLTEDHYFDYLIGKTSNQELIPGVVRRALADTALLFLGFHMDDWDFRVLFRSIMSQEGRSRRRKYAHIAVQIDPEQGRIQEPERARRYLESYFQVSDISIYWGSIEDFVRELQQRWQGDGA